MLQITQNGMLQNIQVIHRNGADGKWKPKQSNKKKTGSKLPDLNPDLPIITCKLSKQRLDKDGQNGYL